MNSPKKLEVPVISNYGEAEKALYTKKVELAQQNSKNAVRLTNTVKADQDLALLVRLFRQQLTLEEVQFVAKQIPEMLGVVKALLPKEDLEEWKETIRTAIDYYAMALTRDKPLADNAYHLTQRYIDSSPVVVAGGFHAAGMAELFRERNLSYIVIAPVVESHTIKDETLYIRRMLGQHVDLSEVAQEASENVKLAAHTLAEEVQDVTKAYNPDETKSPFGVMHQEVASVEKAVTTLSQSQFDALTLQNIGSGMVIDTRYDSGVTISRRNVSHADEALGKHILTALTAMGYGQSQAIKLIEGGVIKIEFVDGLPENRDGRFVPETNTIQINSAIKDNASRLLPTLMEELDHLLTGETDRTVTPRNILNWVKKVGGEAALQVLRDMQIPESDPLFKAVLYAATQIEEEGAKPMRNVEKGGHIWNQDLLDAILDIFMKAPAMAGFNPDAMNSPVKSDQNPGPIGGSSLFDRLRGKYNLPADAGAMAIIMAA